MVSLIFPLRQKPNIDYHNGGRHFTAPRDGGTRKHAGCDLIAPKGTEILAMADGQVIQSPYYFYSGTYALEVKHDNGMVVRYCEISQTLPRGIKSGARVSCGQVIAYVGRLNSGSSMLHLEMYQGTKSGPLTQTGNIYKRRSDLVDPTPYLDNAINGGSTLRSPGEGEGQVNNQVTSVLNVRKQASTTSEILFTLSPGAICKVLGEVLGESYEGGRTDWCKVEYNGQQGFAAAYYIDVNLESRPLTGWDEALPNVPTDGASKVTAAQDGLPPGIQASRKMAETDLARVKVLADRFCTAATKFGVPAAVLAAIASRESRCGSPNILDNGWDNSHNAFGIMQVDKNYHLVEGIPDPISLEHILQATGIFADCLEQVEKKHPDWEATYILKGAAVAYNAGVGTVQTKARMDIGSTGDDYGSDVMARAQYYANHAQLSMFRTGS